jgi:hypothetical protein
MRRKSLSRWKQFSTRWRHLYISVSWGDGGRAVGLGGDHGEGAALVQRSPQGIVVEGLIGDQSSEIEACDQGLHADAVVALAGQQDEAGQVAERIDQGHDLGCQPAARSADGLILSPPFAPPPWRWTLTMVPSMSAYSKSESCESSTKMRSNTPFSAQRRKRSPLPHRAPIAEPRRQITPRRARTHQPQDRLHKQPVVLAGAAGIARLARNKRRDAFPLFVVQQITIQG